MASQFYAVSNLVPSESDPEATAQVRFARSAISLANLSQRFFQRQAQQWGALGSYVFRSNEFLVELARVGDLDVAPAVDNHVCPLPLRIARESLTV